MLTRKPLRRSQSVLKRTPIKRSLKPIRKRNPKRQKTEFQRTYHSLERKRFVRSLGCVYCTMLSPFFGLATCGECDNAHVCGNDGMSRKGDYTGITPLCRVHHRMYDERRGPMAEPVVREAIRSSAAIVERKWLEYHNAGTFTHGESE